MDVLVLCAIGAALVLIAEYTRRIEKQLTRIADWLNAEEEEEE